MPAKKISTTFIAGGLALGLAVIFFVFSLPGTGSKTLSLKHFEYNIEVADDDATRVLGLSGRERLGKNSVMLFVFPRADKQCMWMKDMKFSLDMVWLDSSKKIVKIAEDVAPETYPQAFCADNTKYVLEFNTGTAKKTNLKIGQILNF